MADETGYYTIVFYLRGGGYVATNVEYASTAEEALSRYRELMMLPSRPVLSFLKDRKPFVVDLNDVAAVQCRGRIAI